MVNGVGAYVLPCSASHTAGEYISRYQTTAGTTCLNAISQCRVGIAIHLAGRCGCEGDGALVDRQRPIGRHKAVVGCTQTHRAAGNGVTAHVAGCHGCGAAQCTARHHARCRFVVHKASDGLAQRGVNITIHAGLVVRSHCQLCTGDASGYRLARSIEYIVAGA